MEGISHWTLFPDLQTHNVKSPMSKKLTDVHIFLFHCQGFHLSVRNVFAEIINATINVGWDAFRELAWFFSFQLFENLLIE